MTRILLVEDHTLVRLGIRSLLDGSNEAKVIGEAGNGREAIERAKELQPDLVIMDLAMNELNGIDATRQLLAENSDSRIIILSMHADEQYIFEAMKAGAKGYVLKSSAFSELITGIGEVMAGRTYISPSLSTTLMQDYARRAKGESTPTELNRLTLREREVLQLIAEGNSSSEVGKLLHISVRTVDTHRQNIMDKLKIHTIVGLTKFAIRHGLSQLH